MTGPTASTSIAPTRPTTDPDPQPPNVSTWWAFRTSCTPTACVATGAMLDDNDHQKLSPGGGDMPFVLDFRDGAWQSRPDKVLFACLGPGGAPAKQSTTGDSAAAIRRCAKRHNDRHGRHRRMRPRRRDDRNPGRGRPRRPGTGGSPGARRADGHPACAGPGRGPADRRLDVPGQPFRSGKLIARKSSSGNVFRARSREPAQIRGFS